MLQKLRIVFGVITLLALSGWLWLRKPYSPSNDLPAVYYPAFVVEGIDSVAGAQLAGTVKTWPGINTSSFNHRSSLLSVACLKGTDEDALIAKIQQAAGTSVYKKAFAAPAGAQCPVPFEMIQRIPLYLLLTGYIGLTLTLLTLIPFFTKKNSTIHEKHA